MTALGGGWFVGWRWVQKVRVRVRALAQPGSGLGRRCSGRVGAPCQWNGLDVGGEWGPQGAACGGATQHGVINAGVPLGTHWGPGRSETLLLLPLPLPGRSAASSAFAPLCFSSGEGGMDGIMDQRHRPSGRG